MTWAVTARKVAALALACFLALSVGAKRKRLKLVPAAGQQILLKQFLSETKDGFQVGVETVRDGDAFTVCMVIANNRTATVGVEQERFFMFNAYDRELYRAPDYELKAAWAAFADSPPPPPPPPRRYYTIEPDGPFHFRVQDLGHGYYTVQGYSPSFTIQAHEDYSVLLGYTIGTLIRRALDRRTSRKQIELIDRTYFRNGVVQPGQVVEGCVQFYALHVSRLTPVKLVLFIENTEFQFSFTE